MQVTVHVHRVAAVADDPMAVVVLLVESKHHPIQRRDHVGGRFMHHFQRFRAKDARAVILAALQMRNHEMRHVDAAGRETSGRRRYHDLIGLRGLRCESVALRHVSF